MLTNAKIGWKKSRIMWRTRWTVRAGCLQSILKTYEALLKLWAECWKSQLGPEVRSRIIRCQAKMKTSNFLWGLHLGQRVFAHTFFSDIIGTLVVRNRRKRSNQFNSAGIEGNQEWWCFKAFYETTLGIKQRFHVEVEEPELPKKRKAPLNVWGW